MREASRIFERIEAFCARWRGCTTLERGVPLEVTRGTSNVSNKKDVLIVSVGEPAFDRPKVTADFLNIFSGQGYSVLISHQKEPHTFFQFNGRCLDLRGLEPGKERELSDQPYRMASQLKLECFIDLRPAEAKNLETYLENTRRSLKGVLGPDPVPTRVGAMVYDFTIERYETRAKLDDNAFVLDRDRHSCLSWISLAPIGESAENLISLLGLSETDLQLEVPSYTNAFARHCLATSVPRRNNLLILQTAEPLQLALSRLRDPKYLESLVELDPNP